MCTLIPFKASFETEQVLLQYFRRLKIQQSLFIYALYKVFIPKSDKFII
jgi:hypothetical protein